MSGWAPIHRVVRRIPAGRVASYGQIAALAGRPRAARQVGYALHALAIDSDVPWHRVVDAAGRISARSGTEDPARLQRARLEAEGVTFDARGRIDLERFGWRPRALRPSEPSPRRRAGAGAARAGAAGLGDRSDRSDRSVRSDRPDRSEKAIRPAARDGGRRSRGAQA